MKSKNEARVELLLVRSILAKLRADGDDEMQDILYGVQQALIWMLDEGQAPSNLWNILQEVAGEMGDG